MNVPSAPISVTNVPPKLPLLHRPLVWLPLLALCYMLFRWACFEFYVIPTPSMEGTLLIGDYLVVSKLAYGAITPQTPLQVPLTHQRIPGIGLRSYSDAIQLPTYRLPGLSEIKRNDVVVFHVPFEEQYPADLRTNYIKRCAALPGDQLAIVDRQVVVNGQIVATPGQPQSRYFIRTDAGNDEVRTAFRDHGVREYHMLPTGQSLNDNGGTPTQWSARNTAWATK